MAAVKDQRPPHWMLKWGPRKTGIALVAVLVAVGVGFLVAAIVRVHEATALLALAISFALGAAAVPLLMRQKTWSGSMPSWAFGATIGAMPILGSLLPGPAIVSLLAMAAGFFLTFAPVHMARQRAHGTEIEARWAQWQD